MVSRIRLHLGEFASTTKMPVAKKWPSLRGFVTRAIPFQKNRFML
jgi:hypothetical protein